AQMARSGHIFHTPRLHGQVRGWPVLGQNVGMASSANDVVAYFLGSPSHRALMLDDGFRDIGVGVVYHRGTLFVTVYFGGVAP
ncbi:MAG: CAP domain-containing protein, partial [Actinomycetota bacterium]